MTRLKVALAVGLRQKLGISSFAFSLCIRIGDRQAVVLFIIWDIIIIVIQCIEHLQNKRIIRRYLTSYFEIFMLGI